MARRFWRVTSLILRRRDTEAGLELPTEIVGVREATGLRHLRDGERRLVVKQVDSILQTALVDEVGNGGIVAALREGGTDALLRQMEIVDGGLTVEGGVKEQLIPDDDLANVGKERFARHAFKRSIGLICCDRKL